MYNTCLSSTRGFVDCRLSFILVMLFNGGAETLAKLNTGPLWSIGGHSLHKDENI